MNYFEIVASIPEPTEEEIKVQKIAYLYGKALERVNGPEVRYEQLFSACCQIVEEGLR